MKLLRMSLPVVIRGLLTVCLIFMMGCSVFPVTGEQFADRKVRLGKYDAAIQLYKGLLLESPEDADLYYKLGYALHSWGDYDQAISIYTKSIERKTSFDLEVIYFNRGHAQAEKGDCAQAITDFAKTIELNPQYAKGYNSYAWVLSTCPDAKFRDGDKAIKLVKKALDLAPDKLLYLNNLAVAYAESGDFKQAVSLMEKFIYKLEKKYTSEKIDKDVYLMLESFKAGKPWRDDKRIKF